MKKASGIHFLMLALLAFAGIGLEVLLAFGIEPLIYGASKLSVWQWLLVVIFMIGSLTISYFDWNGSKVIREFYANGPIRFVFQYIYYVFETVLVTLIRIFGQKAFEKWFHRENIPYGGIIVALTWGIGHFFTKDIWTGIVCMIGGLAFGSVYLLVNRDIRKAFPILWIMFVL